MTLKASDIHRNLNVQRTIKQPLPSKIPFSLENYVPAPPIPNTPEIKHPMIISNHKTLQKASGVVKKNKSSLLEQAKLAARNITSLFEGNNVTGNFDNQGLSLGYLQWNIGSGTLQPLLKYMSMGGSTSQIFDEIFEDNVLVEDSNGKTIQRKMSEVLREVLNKGKSEQLEWAKSINNENNQIIEPWKSAFNKLIYNNKFIQIQDNYAKPYLNSAINIMNNPDFGVKTIRGYALAFDIAVQNGSVKPNAKVLIKEALEGKRNKLTDYNHPELTENQRFVIKDLSKRLENTKDNNLKKLYYTAAAVAILSNDKYVKDVWARKSAIVSGTGNVHGRMLDLKKISGLNDFIT